MIGVPPLPPASRPVTPKWTASLSEARRVGLSALAERREAQRIAVLAPLGLNLSFWAYSDSFLFFFF